MSSEFTDVIIDGVNLDDPNLQSWDGATRQLFPEGEFVFEVANISLGQSKAGNNQIIVDWKCVSEGEAYEQTTRGWYGLGQTDNPNSNRIARARLKHVFVDCLGVTMLAGGSFSTGDALGRRMIAEISHESKREFVQTRNAEVDIVRERMHSERPFEDPAAQASRPPPTPATPPAEASKPTARGSRQAVGQVAQARK